MYIYTVYMYTVYMYTLYIYIYIYISAEDIFCVIFNSTVIKTAMDHPY